MQHEQRWAEAYRKQARADFATFQELQPLGVPTCHKLQFLQMACEKLVKAHLCEHGIDPATLQSSHAVIKKHLRTVLRQETVFLNWRSPEARNAMKHVNQLANEIELLAPAVRRGGQREDNCEYPWAAGADVVRSPIEWRFDVADLIAQPAGIKVLKLIRSALER